MPLPPNPMPPGPNCSQIWFRWSSVNSRWTFQIIVNQFASTVTGMGNIVNASAGPAIAILAVASPDWTLDEVQIFSKDLGSTWQHNFPIGLQCAGPADSLPASTSVAIRCPQRHWNKFWPRYWMSGLNKGEVDADGRLTPAGISSWTAVAHEFNVLAANTGSNPKLLFWRRSAHTVSGSFTNFLVNPKSTYMHRRRDRGVPLAWPAYPNVP